MSALAPRENPIADNIRTLAAQGHGSNRIAIIMRVQATRIEAIAAEHDIELAPNPKRERPSGGARKANESPEARRRRLEALARKRAEAPTAVESWATDGEKNEARYGGYVLHLGRLVWRPGTHRVPFTVRPRMGRPPKERAA